MNSKEEFNKILVAGRSGQAYKNYLEVREAVFNMLDNGPALPSSYWREELSGFEYMFDASPAIISKLRHHCYHITGIKDSAYRGHHTRYLPQVEKKLASLRKRDTKNLLIPESPMLGGFGFDIGSKMYNADTLKYYESLLILDQTGLLDKLRLDGKIMMEVGSGWGGFAYQLKVLFPKTTFVFVDIPPVFLFSGTYLKTLFPLAKTLFFDGRAPVNIDSSYDFIFVPNYAFSRIQGKRPDILVNMASFQEMTTSQVDEYFRGARAMGIPLIYSFNRERSPYNHELSAVSSVMEKYYQVQNIPSIEGLVSWRERLRALVKGFRSPLTPYVHLIGSI